MTVVKCSSCGGEVPLPEAAGYQLLTVRCPHCKARFEVALPQDPATEGLPQAPSLPQSDPDRESSERAANQAGGELSAKGSAGTLLVQADELFTRPRRMQLTLEGYLVLKGGMPGEDRFQLSREKTVVGREESDITIEDPTLSRRHFEIESTDEGFFVRDLDSSNGTLLNGTRIVSSPLKSGDEIRAGRTSLIFKTREVIPWTPADESDRP